VCQDGCQWMCGWGNRASAIPSLSRDVKRSVPGRLPLDVWLGQPRFCHPELVEGREAACEERAANGD